MVKVLIVEDEEPIRISLTDMLELAGHQVIIADDGELGLQLAQEHLPDLIISDIMMPKMDGHKMLEAIKSELTTAHIPFIFLTALSSYDDLRTGMNLGADDYLAKPFNYKQLTSAVNARLNKHAQEEQLRLRRFAQRLVDIQERERIQLAYDLEESIQEPLNSLKMLLTLAQQTQDVDIIKKAVDVTEDVINRARSLSQHLMPTMIEHLNIISVLVWLFDEYKTHHNFKIDFERAGYLPDCSMQEKTAIYRIFDEVLSNVLTHAKTKSVSVRIAVRDNYFFADIRDNGQGFDVQQALHGNTTGLQTMFERVTLLNGELNIHSIIGDGSQITITIPVEIDSQEKITSPQQIAKKPDPISQPTSISKVRVLIADDHDIMRHGLQQIINQDDKLHVIKHATIRSELFNSGHQQEIDLILLDIDMEDSGGFNVIKELRQQLPKCHIMALSHHKQAVYAVEAIQSGANGYLLKDTTSIEIIHAIHKVASGEQYICEAIADEVFEWMLNARSTTGTVTNLYNLLTEREREIMLLVLAGSTSADIAEQLTISPRTVEKHRSNFMSKLGLKTPTQLVKFASEQGLIS